MFVFNMLVIFSSPADNIHINFMRRWQLSNEDSKFVYLGRLLRDVMINVERKLFDCQIHQ